MHEWNVEFLKKMRERETEEIEAARRLSRIVANYYTDLLNDGLGDVTSGVLVAHLPLLASLTQANIVRSCITLDIVFYPRRIEKNPSHFGGYRRSDIGTKIRQFENGNDVSLDVDFGRLESFPDINVHVNEKIHQRKMIWTIKKIIEEIFQMHGFYAKSEVCSIVDFPEYMQTHNMVCRIMNALAFKLEGSF